MRLAQSPLLSRACVCVGAHESEKGVWQLGWKGCVCVCGGQGGRWKRMGGPGFSVCLRVSFHPRRKHVISRAPVLLLDRYNIKSHKSECELRGDIQEGWGSRAGVGWG